MNAVQIEKMFGSEINAIREKPNFQNLPYIDRGFTSIGSIPKNSLLFIGLNPSYTEEDPDTSVKYYYLTQTGNKYQKYFKKFEELSKNLNLVWGHIDLLLVRETKQKNIDGLFKEKNGVPFIWEQLQISNAILKEVNPKIIVVCNTKARQLLGKDRNKKNNKGREKLVSLGYNFMFDKKIGTHRITNEDSPLKGTPVFFTSMLTGQRALDNGSFERLEWHIKFVLNNCRSF